MDKELEVTWSGKSDVVADLVIICETEKLLNEVILSFENNTDVGFDYKCQEDQNTYSKQ
jgi:hypothetical protein